MEYNKDSHSTSQNSKYKDTTDDDNDDDGVVDVIDKTCEDERMEDSSSVISSSSSTALPQTISSSPPRSGEKDPGYSSKYRRGLFRKAINEIEDTLINIGLDFDMLDRAERRDLPTTHQELIAKSRNEEIDAEKSNAETITTSLNSSSEVAFSDLDNFMNWNTSSSFENLAEQEDKFQNNLNKLRSRSRTPSNKRSGVYDKKTDDVIYRICKANNKPIPDSTHPISKVNHSYIDIEEKAKQASISNKGAKEVYGEL